MTMLIAFKTCCRCNPKGVWALCSIILAIIMIILPGSTARAEQIVAIVDKTAQRLTVEIDGVKKFEWSISTAHRGYQTSQK
jgi:hypothetical protein